MKFFQSKQIKKEKEKEKWESMTSHGSRYYKWTCTIMAYR